MCKTGTASVCVEASLTLAAFGDSDAGDDDVVVAAAGRRRGGKGLGGVQVLGAESVSLVESEGAAGDSVRGLAMSWPSSTVGRVSAT